MDEQNRPGHPGEEHHYSRPPYSQTGKITVPNSQLQSQRLTRIFIGITTILLVVVIIFGFVIIRLLTTSSQSSSQPVGLVTPTTGALQSETTSTASATLIPTPTSTVALSTYTPGTIICQPSWSNGLQGWSATSDWFVQDGQLLNNGKGSDTGSPTLIPPCQNKLAGVRDYKIVITMQLLQLSNGHFGLQIRGTTTSNGWRGYNAHIVTACDMCTRGTSIDGTAQGASTGDFISDMNKNTYSIEAKGYHITYKVNDAPKIGLDDLTYPSGTDIGFLCSGFQLRVFDIKVIAL